MRVGLNLLYLVPGETGGRETYARELVSAMLARQSGLELVAFVNREAGPGVAGELARGGEVRPVVLPVSARRRAGWAVGEAALVAAAAARARVELLHSMANFGPLAGGPPGVLTIHDLHYKALPELLSPAMRVGTSMLVAGAARHARRIVAVSHAGASEIAAGLGVAPERIDVVPNGVRRPSGTAPDEAARELVRERLRLGERTVALAVASDLPHKNLPRLLEALGQIAGPARPLLVIAGHGTDSPALAARARAAGVVEDVRLLGSVAPAELDGLYAVAACLVVPSLHEGFGLPVLEAMARSLPVACSAIPALEEVGGEVASYFDPRDTASIAASVTAVLHEPGLAERMAAAGPGRAAGFSWDAAAEETLASYRRALASDPAS